MSNCSSPAGDADKEDLASPAVASPQAAALEYARNGLPVFPCIPATKRPFTTHGFKDATTDREQINAWWSRWPTALIGVPTGEASGFAVLDLDLVTDPATGQVVRDGAAELDVMMARNGWTFPDTVEVATPRGGRHLYFRHEAGFRCSTSKAGIDSRAQGGYVIAPGSTLPDGRSYKYTHPEGPFEIAAAPAWLADIFRDGLADKVATAPRPAAQLTSLIDGNRAGSSRRDDVERALHEHWDPDDYGDWSAAALALHGFPDGKEIWLGWAARSAKFNTAENERKWEQTIPSRGITVNSVLARVPRDELVAWGREHARRAGSRTAERGPALTSAVDLGQLYDPWTEPCAPAFPLEVLPEDIARFVEARHIETGACRSAIAMSVLTSASGALTHEARVYLKPAQCFPASPRLWTVLVGNPSAKKTPAMEAAVRPLRDYQKQMHAAILERWRAQQEKLEDDKRKKSEPPEPHLPQFVISDTTPEKLVEVLSGQDRGVLLMADELAGWLGALDRYGAGKGAASSRAVWLQSYDGGYFNLMRIGRKTVPVDNLSVSILGGIQPERLRELGSLQTDGLLQRFLPVMMAKPVLDRNSYDARAFSGWISRVQELVTYERFATHLDPSAQDERGRVAELLFTLGQVESEGSAWQGFVGKLQGIWGSLVLILHCLWRYRAADPVGIETAERASRLIEHFVLPHGLAFYRSLVGTAQSDNRAIGAFLAEWPDPRIKVKDIARGPRCCRCRTPEEIVSKMAPFESGGWLEPDKPGPWNRQWTIAPGLASHFAAEVKRHRQAIAMLQGSLKGEWNDK